MITSWSYSRWTTYQQCPLRAKLLYVDRLQEPSTKALENGVRVHAEIEAYLKSGGDVPESVKLMRTQYEALRKLEPMVEMELAFNDRWERVDWFDKDAWCRIKVDAAVPPRVGDDVPTVFIVDHKTGKVKGDHSEYAPQMELYGLGALLAWPSAERAVAELWFVDHGKAVPHHEDFVRADIERLKEAWNARVSRMLSDTRFDPSPSDKCRWCVVGKGRCDYATK
jgi:RecB family exonuclease